MRASADAGAHMELIASRARYRRGGRSGLAAPRTRTARRNPATAELVGIRVARRRGKGAARTGQPAGATAKLDAIIEALAELRRSAVPAPTATTPAKARLIRYPVKPAG